MTLREQPRLATEDAAVHKLEGQLSSNRAPAIAAIRAKRDFGLCPSKARENPDWF